MKWHVVNLEGTIIYKEGFAEYAITDETEENPLCLCPTEEIANEICRTLNGEPKYSSIIEKPTLNNSSKECRECAKHYSGLEENKVSIEDLFYAIESLHCCGKYLGHPCITLHSDGSGHIEGRFGDDLGGFRNLKKLVKITNNNMKEMEDEENDT